MERCHWITLSVCAAALGWLAGHLTVATALHTFPAR